MAYGAVVLEHFRRPRFSGALESPQASSEGVNPLCGDRLRVELRLDDGRLTARFRADACAICVAAASLLMERVQDRSSADARRVAPDEILALLGSAIPAGRVRCAALPLETFRAALALVPDEDP